MKKRVIYQYIIWGSAAVAVIALCYLASYRMAMRQFERQLESYRVGRPGPGLASEGESDSQSYAANKEGAATGDSLEPQGGGAAPETEEAEALAAGNTGSGTITPETKYVLEIFDSDQDYLTEYELSTPGYLVGLTREGVEEYIKGYMADVPLDEFQMGLVSYDIISFSPEKVVLRKVYDQKTVPYQYYLVVERGYLVVYYADQKTVYEYTGIEASSLPEEEQVRLAYGIFLKDQKELYGLLQGYSS